MGPPSICTYFFSFGTLSTKFSHIVRFVLQHLTQLKHLLVHTITRNLAVVHRVTANNRLLESNRFMRWRCPSVCLSVSRQNAYTKRDSLKKTKQFRAMFSIDDHALPHELFKEPIFGTPKFHDGGRPPSWKSLSRHILTKNYPILFKFGTQ